MTEIKGRPFDPAQGTTVVEPAGAGKGHWVGALGVLHDPATGDTYMFYRSRRPIGEGRGWKCQVSRSEDGEHFTEAWTCTKEQLDAESIEGGALARGPDGSYRLYVSYLDNADRRWKIALIEADSVAEFDPAQRRVVFSGEDADSDGVKDPHVAVVDGRYYMFLNHAPKWLTAPATDVEEMHGTGNVFATKFGGSGGLATSEDGVHFVWQGDVIAPGHGWDSLLTRIDTMLWQPPLFVVYYSGRGSVEETYEDRTGVAVSLDLERFHKLSDDAPLLVSPLATGALRYMDAVVVGDEVLYYYEYARADGAHEIRMSKTSSAPIVT